MAHRLWFSWSSFRNAAALSPMKSRSSVFYTLIAAEIIPRQDAAGYECTRLLSLPLIYCNDSDDRGIKRCEIPGNMEAKSRRPRW
jgi:hypothetical protein